MGSPLQQNGGLVRCRSCNDLSLAQDNSGDRLSSQGIQLVESIQNDQVCRLPRFNAVGILNVQRTGSGIRYHVKHGTHFFSSRHLGNMHCHMRYVQHAAGSHRIPGVEDIVMTKAHVDAHGRHLLDPCHTTSLGIRVEAALQMDVHQGICNEVDAALCTCLLYTSDAADEEDSVDLGG